MNLSPVKSELPARKIPHGFKLSTIFHDTIARTLIMEHGRDGLIVYLSMNSKDFTSVTGIKDPERIGGYVHGFYLAEFNYEAGSSSLKVEVTEGNIIEIEYKGITAVSLGNNCRFLQPVKGINEKPRGYDELIFNSSGTSVGISVGNSEKLTEESKNIVMFPEVGTLQ